MTDKNLCWWIKDDNSYEPAPRSSRIESNKGILWQIKNNPIIAYSRPNGMTSRDLALAMMDIYNGYFMKYSGNKVTTEEELDIEVTHFKFLNKYGLL